MVKAIIDINDRTNRVINVVKAKYGLRDKSQAIEVMAAEYEAGVLEPELRPEFIEKMKLRQNEQTVKIDDFRKHFGI